MNEHLLWGSGVILLLEAVYAPCIMIRSALQENGYEFPWTILLNPVSFLKRVQKIQRESSKDLSQVKKLYNFFFLNILYNAVIFVCIYWLFRTRFR